MTDIIKNLFLVLVLIALFGCLFPVQKNQTIVQNQNNSDTAVAQTNISANLSTNDTEADQPQNWSEFQMKFTYVGSQEKIIPSVAIFVSKYDPGKFQDRTLGFDYSNDNYAMKEVRITANEMKNITEAIFKLDFINARTIPSDTTVSFMVYNASSSTVSEFLLTTNQSESLTDSILGSLTVSRSNASAALVFYD